MNLIYILLIVLIRTSLFGFYLVWNATIQIVNKQRIITANQMIEIKKIEESFIKIKMIKSHFDKIQAKVNEVERELSS